jgi:hypothetical protein
LFLAPFAPRRNGTHGERRAPVDTAVIGICCIGAVLALLLTALRARILFSWPDLRSPTRILRGLPIGAYADLAYVAGLTGAFVVLCLLARGRPRVQRLMLGISARRFASFYTHQPSTSAADRPRAGGRPGNGSFRVLTREHPDIALLSLSGELKRQGYRTAIINAGDNQFQGADVFLSHRQFDRIADGSTGSCAASRRDLDDYMVGDLAMWIDRDSPRPFFAVLWTAQTHFPYFAPSTPREGEGAPTRVADQRPPASLGVRFGRYLRALHETDRALGKLLRQLQERGLLNSTLVIVFGDHGKAFGQHGNAFHRFLYEEEVRVPLLLINSRLFRGEIDSVPGGTIDLAPTVMDLLGYRLPAEWQGQSLFDSRRHGRVYLFGPYSGLFGYREGTRKFIYDPIANEDELYDLAADPQETLNIAFRHPEAVQECRERLAAWVQQLDRFYRQHGASK